MDYQQHPQKQRHKEKCKKKKHTKNSRTDRRIHEPRLITTPELSELISDAKASDSLRLQSLSPTLPPSFFLLFKFLRVLVLKSCGLTNLPPQIIELENLQKLDVRYNTQLTYLPSQIAQLPNLHQLQTDDIRDRRTRLLKETSELDTDVTAFSIKDSCTCKETGSQKIPPIPTLAQLCARTVLSSLPPTKANDPDTLSWEELEPLYKTGQFLDTDSDISRLLPFPSHLLPAQIPLDLCSSCSNIALPNHAEFIKFQLVALCRVRLRYVFCSHKCLAEVVTLWELEEQERKEKQRLRQQRFEVKSSTSEPSTI